jgi:hypothetical protein
VREPGTCAAFGKQGNIGPKVPAEARTGGVSAAVSHGCWRTSHHARAPKAHTTVGTGFTASNCPPLSPTTIQTNAKLSWESTT